MKQLQNRAITMLTRGEKLEATYVDLARSCLEHPPKGGFTLDEQRKRLRVLEALDGVAEDGPIKLEDGDAETLQECAKLMRWSVLAKEIDGFVREVEGMQAPPELAAEPDE